MEQRSAVSYRYKYESPANKHHCLIADLPPRVDCLLLSCIYHTNLYLTPSSSTIQYRAVVSRFALVDCLAVVIAIHRLCFVLNNNTVLDALLLLAA